MDFTLDELEEAIQGFIDHGEGGTALSPRTPISPLPEKLMRWPCQISIKECHASGSLIPIQGDLRNLEDMALGDTPITFDIRSQVVPRCGTQMYLDRLAAHCSAEGVVGVVTAGNNSTVFNSIATYLAQRCVLGVVEHLCAGAVTATIVPPGAFSVAQISGVSSELIPELDIKALTSHVLVFLLPSAAPLSPARPLSSRSGIVSFSPLPTMAQGPDTARTIEDDGLCYEPLLTPHEPHSNSHSSPLDFTALDSVGSEYPASVVIPTTPPLPVAGAPHESEVDELDAIESRSAALSTQQPPEGEQDKERAGEWCGEVESLGDGEMSRSWSTSPDHTEDGYQVDDKDPMPSFLTTSYADMNFDDY